ncbi:SCO family protein [Bacillus sp. 31A1R]|uniref:SCO family protein n=1 Tax=Robertmurraya mangrovi TaxID=3098077 RepID=A0ABU5J119_9BACI|nr:SCO family protein [Bacillus sp. 31A1R]MDZ5473118.1 SCO family protein [Bacillus sp. 31A1R]
MNLKLFKIILLATVLLLAACGQKGIKNAKDWPVEDFTFINHEGQSFGLEDLKGKIWVADFIFTNCEDVCLPMTSNMVRLQQMVKEKGYENVEFVSFSIDPEVDKPETLKEFGNKFNVDYSNFHFLTGYEQTFIETFAQKNFKALVKKPANEDQVIHGVDFYLVNKEGTIVKYYNGLNEIPFKEILNDIEALQ